MKLATDAAKQEIIALLKANQPARAKQLCMGLEEKATDPHVLALLATAHLRLGELDAAVSAAREAVKGGWKDRGTLVMLVALLAHQGKSADADRYTGNLHRTGINKIDAHREVAGLLRQLGDRSNAIAQYRRAVALGPKNAVAHFDLAATLQETGQLAEATDWYEKTIAIHPTLAPAHCNLGISLAGLEQYDKAAHALEQSLRLDPSNALAHFHLGETYQLQHRYPAAAACYRRALELQPNEAALHGSLGRALQNLGDTAAAVACHRRALQLEPKSAAAYHHLGICLYDDRDLEPARKAFAEAVHLDPNSAQSLFFLGLIYSQGGDEIEAREHFHEACRVWPYLECFVDSYLYARERGPDARYFSLASRVFEHAVAHSAEDGLFLEFGVYNGASINIIASLTSSVVHGFDTFAGLPTDWVVGDKLQKDVEIVGSYSTHGQLPDVPGNVQLHAGTFEETLPGFCSEHSERASFINIDCDLYGSTRTIFQHLAGQIQQGTVIVFDEYFCLPGWRDHEYRAFQEYISASQFSYEYLGFSPFTGQAIVRITKG